MKKELGRETHDWELGKNNENKDIMNIYTREHIHFFLCIRTCQQYEQAKRFILLLENWQTIMKTLMKNFLLIDTNGNSNGKLQLIIINENIDEIFFVDIYRWKVWWNFKKQLLVILLVFWHVNKFQWNFQQKLHQ